MNKLQEIFDNVHAEDALKDKTRVFLRKKTRDYQKNKASRFKRMIPAVACVLLLLAGWGGYRIYFTPTAVLSIDINPSVELGINRFDRVVSVKEYQDDEENLTGSTSVRFMEYTEALEQILSSEPIADLVAQDEVLSITVIGSDEGRTEEMLSSIEKCTAGQKNTYCYAANSQEVAAAHEAGLSYGKYRAFLEVQALDPTITAEEVKNMTMRQIRDLIKDLSGDDFYQPQSDGTQSGHRGLGNGYGSGQGKGKGNMGNE